MDLKLKINNDKTEKNLFQATDPENDPVSYSIISGNDLRQFGIDDKTGVISVIRRLDREDLTRYELVSKPISFLYLQSITVTEL